MFQKPDRQTKNGIPVEKTSKDLKEKEKREKKAKKEQEKKQKEAQENKEKAKKEQEIKQKEAQENKAKAKKEQEKKQKEAKEMKEKAAKEKKEQDKAKKESNKKEKTDDTEAPKSIGFFSVPSDQAMSKDLAELPKTKPKTPRTHMEPYKGGARGCISREVPACCLCIGLETAMVAIGFLNIVCGGALILFAFVLHMLWWNFIAGGLMAFGGFCSFIAVCGRNKIASWMSTLSYLLVSGVSLAGMIIAIMWVNECLSYCSNNDCEMESYCWGWGLIHIILYAFQILMSLHAAQVSNTWRKRRTGKNRSERRWTIPDDS